MTILDYILELNNHCNKAKTYEMALPGACFEDTGQKKNLLTRETFSLACPDLQYKAMQSVLKRMSDESASFYSDVKN